MTTLFTLYERPCFDSLASWVDLSTTVSEPQSSFYALYLLWVEHITNFIFYRSAHLPGNLYLICSSTYLFSFTVAIHVIWYKIRRNTPYHPCGDLRSCWRNKSPIHHLCLWGKSIFPIEGIVRHLSLHLRQCARPNVQEWPRLDRGRCWLVSWSRIIHELKQRQVLAKLACLWVEYTAGSGIETDVHGHHICKLEL